MNDLDVEAMRVLEGARRELEPSAADAERVLAATRRALLAGHAATADGSQHAQDALRPSSGRPLRRVAARALGSRLLAALCLAGASGAAGYYAGERAGRQEHSQAVAIAQVRPPSEGARPTQPLPPPAAAPAASAAVPPVATPAPGPAPRSAPAGRAAAAPVAAASLQQESRMLARVERALREHNPQQALVLLGELDRKLPGGQLREERLAAFIIARCSLGLGSPALLVAEFSQHYPGSVYFARVRQSCAAGEDAVLPNE